MAYIVRFEVPLRVLDCMQGVVGAKVGRARGGSDVAGGKIVERPKALLDWFFHTATTATYQVKGETSTSSNLHASYPGS